MFSNFERRGVSQELYEDSFHSRLIADRRAFSELFVTVVLFGLTLNLLSDLIWSLTDLLIDPLLVIIARISLGIIAIAGTIILFRKMLFDYLGDEATQIHDTWICLFWNHKSGIIPDLSIDYIPQYKARELVAKMSQVQREELSAALILEPPDIPEHTLIMIQSLFEIILFRNLGALHDIFAPRSLTRMIWKGPTIRDVLNNVNDIVPDELLDDTAILVPGEFDARYSRGTPGTGNLEIKWKNDLNGRINISFEVIIDYLESNIDHERLESLNPFPIEDLLARPLEWYTAESTDRIVGFMANINIAVTFDFSPYRLWRRKSHVDVLIMWLLGRLDSFRRYHDWHLAKEKAGIKNPEL